MFGGVGKVVTLVGVVLVFPEELDFVFPDVSLAILQLQQSALLQDCQISDFCFYAVESLLLKFLEELQCVLGEIELQ